MAPRGFSRRSVLRGLAAGLAGAAVIGTGAAGVPTGEYVVACRSPTAVRAARARATGLRHAGIDLGRFGTLVVGRFPAAALEGLRNHPGVRYVAPDATVYAVADDTAETTPNGVVDVGATTAYAAGYDGAGARVAVVDSGADLDHPDLAAKVGEGYNARNPDDQPNDRNGHGTHVAGTAAAVAGNGVGVVGVAPAATIHPVKVLGADGSGSFSDVIEGIRWVADRASADWGADTTVINMSLGARLHPYALYGSTIQSICEACQYAADAGVVLAAAAGNDSRDAGDHYPSACDTVIAVGAVDDDLSLASFSNDGDTVELVAPGVTVDSTWLDAGYRVLDGTSMASPHVAGVAALLLSTGDYTAAGVRSRLHATARDLGTSGRDATYGYGLVDAADALGLSGETDTTGPAAPTEFGATAVSDASVDLAWNHDGNDLAGFRLYEGGTPIQEPAASARSATVSGLSAGTTYQFELSAVDAAGNESSRASLSVTTAADTTAPAAPTGLQVTDATADSVSLSWTASTSGDVERYDVDVSPGASLDGTVDGSTTETTYTAIGLDPETTYTIGVRAVDGSGDASAYVDVTATTDAASSGTKPTATVSLSEEGSPNPHATLTVAWSADDADGDLATTALVVTDDTDDGRVVYESTATSGTATSEVKFGGEHTYTATVTATDATGLTGTATQTITAV